MVSRDQERAMADPSDLDLWDEAAACYDDAIVSGRDWRKREVLEPAIADLLGEVTGEDILDAGCGQGWLSFALAGRGARVVGVDGSAELLALARRESAEGVRFVQANLCAPLPLATASFDTVVSNMVLMDLPEISTALAEFRRVLRPQGRLIFSITHPCFYPWRWTRGPNGEKLYKPIDEYLSQWSSATEFWGPTRHYHRPLSYYTGEVSAAGFVMDTLLEPVPIGPRRPERDHSFRIPDFVIIRARGARR